MCERVKVRGFGVFSGKGLGEVGTTFYMYSLATSHKSWHDTVTVMALWCGGPDTWESRTAGHAVSSLSNTSQLSPCGGLTSPHIQTKEWTRLSWQGTIWPNITVNAAIVVWPVSDCKWWLQTIMTEDCWLLAVASGMVCLQSTQQYWYDRCFVARMTIDCVDYWPL